VLFGISSFSPSTARSMAVEMRSSSVAVRGGLLSRVKLQAARKSRQRKAAGCISGLE